MKEYFESHNQPPLREKVIFRFCSQYAYHSDGLCSMWEKNIRRHSESAMCPIMNIGKNIFRIASNI